MVLKILIVLTLLNYSVSKNYYPCTDRSALLLLKRPAYEFSMSILEKVAHNSEGHFTFSPFATWLQLNALAAGAEGRTLRELRNFTQIHRQLCFRVKFANILRKMRYELRKELKLKSALVAHKFLDINSNYIIDVKKYYGVKVMPLDFYNREAAAERVNEFISMGIGEDANKLAVEDDFHYTVMLLLNNVLLTCAWKYPFDPALTKQETFTAIRGEAPVNMMSITGYFNLTELPYFNIKVLEIPFVGDYSMLIIKPLKDDWVGDTFYNLQKTNLNSIFHRFKLEKEKLVSVKLPRFRIDSVTENLPELLYDMGIKRVFDPIDSELGHITRFQALPSVMTQFSSIEVTENGMNATASPGFLHKDTEDSFQFIANEPFAYILVNRINQFILFGGAYSSPSLY